MAAAPVLPISTSGCLNEQLSDGIWAVRILSVQSGVTYDDGVETKGIGVNLQVKNISTRPLHPDQTGFSDINGSGIKVRFADGRQSAATLAGNPAEVLFDRRLVPGETSTLALYFPYDAKSHGAHPVQLTIPVSPHSRLNSAHVSYETSEASFHVDLTCRK